MRRYDDDDDKVQHEHDDGDRSDSEGMVLIFHFVIETTSGANIRSFVLEEKR